VMRVIESAVVRPIPPSNGEVCLYIRRDVFPDGSYKEYSYVGPEAEVNELAARCTDVDMLEVDEQLRKGLSFEDALRALGVP
jgi:hypothetical protein